MEDVNSQRSYSLGEEYESIKARAVVMLEKFLSSDVVSFNDSEKTIAFTTERLIPKHSSTRPRVILLFSNPHPHSIQQGMFLSATARGRENLFWSSMIAAGWFSLGEHPCTPEYLANTFLNVQYHGPFELSFFCYYAFPTHLPDDIRRIFGERFFSQVIAPEAASAFGDIVDELTPLAIVTFNKGIFNLVSSHKVERFIDRLNEGKTIQGSIDGRNIRVFLTYPTGWRYHKEYEGLRIAGLKRIRDAILGLDIRNHNRQHGCGMTS